MDKTDMTQHNKTLIQCAYFLRYTLDIYTWILLNLGNEPKRLHSTMLAMFQMATFLTVMKVVLLPK